MVDTVTENEVKNVSNSDINEHFLVFEHLITEFATVFQETFQKPDYFQRTADFRFQNRKFLRCIFSVQVFKYFECFKKKILFNFLSYNVKDIDY